MSKVITLVKSNGLAPAEFREYWREEWLKSLLEESEVTDNLARVVHNHVLPTQAREGEPDEIDQWAGVAEFWYYDKPSAQRYIDSESVKRVMASHFEKVPEVSHLHVYEIAGWERKSHQTAMKLLGLFKPPKGMARENALAYWKDNHLQVTARLGMSQKLFKYVQNHCFEDAMASDDKHNFCGGPEMWIESQEEAQSIFADQALLSELRMDEAEFADPLQSFLLVLEEEEVFTYKADS